MPNRLLMPLLLLVSIQLGLASVIYGQTVNSEPLPPDGEVASYEWLKTLPKPWRISEQEINRLLPEFQHRFPSFKARLRALAYWRLGTPYKIFNLGEEREPDPDPLFRLDVSDCTSHILTSLSLAQSQSWEQARQNMIQLHYKTNEQGIALPDYKSRWHFTSDRLLHHPATPNISHQYLPASKMRQVDIVLNQKQDRSEFLALGWTQRERLTYIPSEQVTDDLLARLPEVVGVAFVKQSYFKMGLAIAHEGMLLDGQNLLHAGQVAGKTVIEGFMPYYHREDGPRFDGIMLYDLMPLDSTRP